MNLNLTRCVCLLLCACSASDPQKSPVTDAGGSDVNKRDSEIVVPEEDAGPSFTVSGIVQDTDGRAWAGATVQVCGKICNLAFADAKGVWSTPTHPEGKHLRVDGAIDEIRLFSPVIYHLSVTGDLALPAPTLLVVTPPATPLLPWLHDVTVGELTLSLDSSKLTLPPNVTVAAVSSVRVPKAAWPPYDVGAKTVLAMWAMNAYATRSSVAVPVSIAVAGVTLGLAPGDAAVLLSVDPDTGLLIEPATATVSAKGDAIVTDSAQGLRRLTWVVLAR